MVEEFKAYGTGITVAKFSEPASTKRKSIPFMFPGVDVIVASYKEVNADKVCRGGSILGKYYFRRVVVDEFQALSAKNSAADKAACTKLTNAIQAIRRLSTVAVSGTPFVTDLHESAKSLLRLLNVHPFSRQVGRQKSKGKGDRFIQIECPYANMIEEKIAAGDAGAAIRLVELSKSVIYRNEDNLADVLGIQIKHCMHLCTPCESEKFVYDAVQEAIKAQVVDGINAFKSEEAEEANLDARKATHLLEAVEFLRRLLSTLCDPIQLEMLVDKDYEELLKKKKGRKAEDDSLLAQAAWYNDVDEQGVYLASTHLAGFDKSVFPNHANFNKTIGVYSKTKLYKQILDAIPDTNPSAATVSIPDDQMFAGVECVVCKEIPTTLVLTAKCGHNFCPPCYKKTHQQCKKNYDRYVLKYVHWSTY